MPPIGALKIKHWLFSTSLPTTCIEPHGPPWMRLMLSSPSKQATPQASDKLRHGPEPCQGGQLERKERGLVAVSDTTASLADDSSQHSSFLPPHTHTPYPCQVKSSNPNNPSFVEKSNIVRLFWMRCFVNFCSTNDCCFHPCICTRQL